MTIQFRLEVMAQVSGVDIAVEAHSRIVGAAIGEHLSVLF